MGLETRCPSSPTSKADRLSRISDLSPHSARAIAYLAARQGRWSPRAIVDEEAVSIPQSPVIDLHPAQVSAGMRSRAVQRQLMRATS